MSPVPLITAAARLADEQLALALAAIHDAHTLGSGALPGARRHIRKAKVLMRLLDPALDDGAGAEAERRLRALNRRLAPLADAAAALRAIAHLAAREGAGTARPAIATIRHALVRHTEESVSGSAIHHLLQWSEGAIAVERARIGTWTVRGRHRDAVATAIDQRMRAAAKALGTAVEWPAGTGHGWLRHATELWLGVRLLGTRRELRPARPLVEAMDASLDELRSVAALETMLTTGTIGSRSDRAIVLRLARRYHREVHARAVMRTKAALALRTRPRTHEGRPFRHEMPPRQRWARPLNASPR